MSAFSVLRTILDERVGPDGTGTEYEGRRDRAINWAIKEICTVRFNFLLTNPTPDPYIELAANVTSYNLASDFHMPYKFYIEAATRYELIPGTYDDIVLIDSLVDLGDPKYFAIAGTDSDGYLQVQFGDPTPSQQRQVYYSYYRLLPELSNATDESAISIVYRDDPIIEGALYKYWLDFEKQDKSQAALQRFVWAMTMMESVMEFEGDSYSEKLKSLGGGPAE